MAARAINSISTRLSSKSSQSNESDYQDIDNLSIGVIPAEPNAHKSAKRKSVERKKVQLHQRMIRKSLKVIPHLAKYVATTALTIETQLKAQVLNSNRRYNAFMGSQVQNHVIYK